jgi:hypothetical protein
MKMFLLFIIPALLCFSIGIGVLYWLNSLDLGGVNSAFGKGTVGATEKENGLYTTTTLNSKEIATATKQFNPHFKTILWLGNSQQHAINQIKTGDHLSPYWLKKSLHDSVNVWGVSMPNINFMETSIIAKVLLKKEKMDILILAAVFDKLREGDIREEIIDSVYGPNKSLFSQSESGRIIESKTSGTKSGDPKKSGFKTTQESVETYLNNLLTKAWKLWANRGTIRTNLYLLYYNARNKLLGIKPTSIRKQLPGNTLNNMLAFDEILRDAQSAGTKTIIYIAPIRHDYSLPYEVEKYNSWKDNVRVISVKHNAQFVNLEDLVPNEYWGLTDGEKIDFMHFQGQGHKILGEKMAALVQTIGR